MITQDKLKELLDYDFGTGEFIWKITKTSRATKGSVAGTLQAAGYRTIKIDGKSYMLHRLVWLYVYGEFPRNFLDHIDRDRVNNRITNLREATNSQNQANTCLNVCNKSGQKGVCWHIGRNKWYVSTKIDGKSKHLGSSVNKEEAAAIYNNFMQHRHPEFFNDGG